MAAKRGRIGRQDGQGLVEFALVLPILLLLLLGIVQFGLLFGTQLNIENASREGARLASVLGQTETSGNPEITARVHQAAGGLDTSKMVITITPSSPSSRLVGTPITVTVVYSSPVFIPVVSDMVAGGVVSLSSFSAGRSEQ